MATTLAILATAFTSPAMAQFEPGPAEVVQGRQASVTLETIIVTARLREENAQTVPISLSVVDANTLEMTRTDNIAQVSRLVPSLNFTSPNPRNTAVTIRGLGSSVVAIAQANDGLEPGVGFYVDEVYHGRPATAAFDFVDLDRVEVLRGPQGTLFGKNTTAGAINITSKEPGFQPEGAAELAGGDSGYYQARGFISGPLAGETLAGRLSGAITGRDGVLDNVTTGGENNDVQNSAVRGQFLYTPTETFRLRLIANYSSLSSNCCTQVYFAVGTSLKPADRQFPALAAGVGYAPPSLNPYDRQSDIDAPLKVDTNEGGMSAIAAWDLGSATATSVSAWRYWNWDPANDRDYTSLSIQTQQKIPSRQDQYSQELRIASDGARPVSYVAGLYWYAQTLTGEPTTQYGPVAAYWLLGPAPTYPANLLDGYMTDGDTRFHSDSYAAFGEVTWQATQKLAVTTGLRYTDERKDGRFESTVSGGLETADPALIKAKLSILRPQSYSARDSDGSLSGRASLSYAWNERVMAYASFARASKSGGINMSGLPLDVANQPALATAVIKPEDNTTVEIGIKTEFFDRRLLVNASVYDTVVQDYQTNVVDTGPGALRGYLANIDKVEVKGLEIDARARLGEHFSGYASVAYTDGTYESYENGPCPLELIGTSTTVCDLSGKRLTGTPRWAESIGAEYTHFLRAGSTDGELYIRADLSSRSNFYGDPSDSKYTLIDGYTVVNASVGFRESRHWDLSVWARNLFNTDYMQNLTVQAGNSGLIVGTPGDELMAGLTARVRF